LSNRVVPTAPAPEPAARELRVGGFTPFTSIDFPGRLSAVVFVQGCPWRCTYCHNPHLQSRQAQPGVPSWAQIRETLRRRVGLIDAVVFSGGEPTVDPALADAIAEVKALGFEVGLHSAGTHPRRLREVLPLVDWVGLDVKAPLHQPERYAQITGVPGSADTAAQCLQAVIEAGVPHELRTTAHPDWLDDDALKALADDLAQRGAKVSHYALQIARPVEAMPRSASVVGYPAEGTVTALQTTFAAVEIRRA
jgi:pyruvate formate lyase activating enzyme